MRQLLGSNEMMSYQAGITCVRRCTSLNHRRMPEDEADANLSSGQSSGTWLEVGTIGAEATVKPIYGKRGLGAVSISIK